MRRLLCGLVILVSACAGTGPRAGADPAPQRFPIFFQSWSAKLDDPAMGVIAHAAQVAKDEPTQPVHVIGYASTIGSNAANQDLSRLRAQVAIDALVQAGVDPARLLRDAKGPVPYADDPTEARRVEIVVGTP